MEDMKNQFSLNGNWGHSLHSTRPFFCVPPPTQPYYTTYPWHPYSQYGFPWPGMPYGRYMAPVQYMQQASYVVPQAPLYPVDYRRTLSQHYVFPPARDVNFPCHVEQSHLQRETVCSEVQTEPYDAVSKPCEKPGEDMGSNCAVISSTPAAIQHPEKEEVPRGSDGPPRVCSTRQKQGDDAIQQSSLNECSTVLCDAESSQGCLEQCVLSDVLPFDGSSVHYVCPTEGVSESDQQSRSQKPGVSVMQQPPEEGGHQMEDTGKTPCTDSGVHECGPSTENLESAIQSYSSPKTSASKHDPELVQDLDPIPETDSLLSPGADVDDLPFRILRLPCTKMTTTGLLGKSEPLWSIEKANPLLPPQSCLLRTGSYSYYPHAEQERQSVLSPSLDELSSRDELFSTDVEDVDLVSEPVYLKGSRLDDGGSDAYSTPSKQLEDAALEEEEEEECTACQETCSTCGLSMRKLSLEPEPSRYPKTGQYCGEVLEADLDYANVEEGKEEWSSYEAREVPVKNMQRSSWHSVSACVRPPKYKPKKDYCGAVGAMDEEEQGHGCLRGPECCKREAIAKTDKSKGRASRCAPPRLYFDKQWGEGTTASNKESWGNGVGKHKAKTWKPSNKNPELATRKGASCKMFEQQRPRRNEFDDYNDEEFSHSKRGRGSTKKKNTRC